MPAKKRTTKRKTTKKKKGATPTNKALYARVKAEAKRTYKARGGGYR